MFQHLDDPVGFQPDEQFRRGVTRRGRRLQLRRRAVASVTGLALTVGVAGVAGGLYVERRDAAIDRIDVETAPSLDGATNILLIGSDTRSPGSEGADEVAGSRADTILVVRVSLDGSVNVLGVPRDLRDPATGQEVNAYAGDPQTLVDTVHRVLGLPIDHYVEVDLDGFVSLVDGLGGLQIAVDVPLRDPDSGLDLQPSPCATLDGATALALVRARHVDGDPTGDFGRVARAQGVLAAAVAAIAEEGTDPVAIDRISRLLADHAIVDAGLSLARMAEIGRAIAAAGPAGVQTTALPVVVAEEPTGSNLVQLAPESTAVLQQFGATAAPLLPEPTGVPGAPPSLDDAITGLHPC